MRAGSRPASVSLRQKPRGIVSHFWRRILDLTLVLWVVRVPLLSVLLGLALMAGVTQAQDVTLDVAMAGAPAGAAAGLSRAIVSLVAAVFLLWAMPVHYAARLLVETDDGLAVLVARRDASAGHRGVVGRDRLMAATVREVPRLIGLAPFLAFAMGANAAIGNLPTLADRPAIAAAHHQLVLLVWAMLAAVPLFYLYCVLRGRLTQVTALAALDRVLGRWLKPVFGLLAIAPRRDDAAGQLHASGRLALLFYALLVVAVLVASPHWLAARLPLAFAVPLIFGGWVPILAYLSSVGRRFHVPILTGLFIAGAVGVYVFGDNHAVRTVTADEPAYRRTSLVQAVHLWMRANGCAEQPSSCPRPIIVAAAGGASRAGFFTASVIGHFLDYDRQKQAFGFTRADGSKVSRAARDDGRFSAAIQSVLDGQERQGKNVATHLFALSGVSGGSYGAAVVAAALSARTGTAPPCPTEAPAHWFGGAIHGWRDCLESMTADDFLTATFFGLAFHDQVQLFLRDRAALLEEAWEASFARHVAAAGANAGPGAARRLSEPFLGAPRDPEHWVPYLVLNGTSVETGQRIITTDILPTYAASSRCPSGGPTAECPIFTHAIDFHSLVRSDLDVRLSTAATNSARFPVISPPGSIYQVDTDVVDRIVDGGYFENFGAESALELAQAMVDVEPALAPFVLVVSNDPQSVLTEERTARGVVVPDAAEHSFLPEVVGPVDAIGAVRSGRGRLAVAHAAAWLDGRFGGRCAVNLVQIKVWPEDSAGHCPVGTATPEKIRQVSMSWWLSKPVQMNLHEQLEPTADRCNNRTAVEQVWTALATRSEACTGPTP
ncbi:hypothetical protein [Xanthobacter aminoxidans]|uniref:hypothetical protein n=1 Tax=Xanthobacter aminoxidans TaxID=186280 RepID=UPI002022DA56|nr:hypothetical protein [Xanthobacter aminoxidans]MCL8383113.1 hypothetical protein [Xanthobacter aminoxidans]